MPISNDRQSRVHVCLNCGTAFRPIRRSAGRYCSMRCVWSANSARAARNRELNPIPDPVPLDELLDPPTVEQERVEAIREDLAEAVRRLRLMGQTLR